MKLQTISIILLNFVVFLTGGCLRSDDCLDRPIDCYNECECPLQFQFQTTGSGLFERSEIQYISIVRYLKANRSTSDTIDLKLKVQLGYYYEESWASPHPFVSQVCDPRSAFEISWNSPFGQSIFDEYDYDIIVPRVDTFRLRNMLETGSVKTDFNNCTKCYRTDSVTFDLDGVRYVKDRSRFNFNSFINLSKK